MLSFPEFLQWSNLVCPHIPICKENALRLYIFNYRILVDTPGLLKAQVISHHNSSRVRTLALWSSSQFLFFLSVRLFKVTAGELGC